MDTSKVRFSSQSHPASFHSLVWRYVVLPANGRLFSCYSRGSLVSPPQEHIQGDQWWTDYQPVSYILTSKRGDRDQFANMISTCHAAGVGVIVGEHPRRFADLLSAAALSSNSSCIDFLDTIWNHMTGNDSGTGVAGSSYTHYDYPGIYEYQDFHHCGLEPNDDIVNYDNRLEVQTCQLDGLAE